MIILLHSSKTMKAPAAERTPRSPQLLDKARQLDAYLKTLKPEVLMRVMEVSPALAAKTQTLIADWHARPAGQSLALDSFVGDIYSGLQVSEFSPADRDYADKTLYILSGLYGVLRPCDGIRPYRLEMGYKLPDPVFASLYDFWGDSIAECLPKEDPIINLAAVEYSKTVTPFVDKSRIITPRFLTISPKTGQPAMVIVHTKIARGAFARWFIQNRVTEEKDLIKFSAIGYNYDAALSTPDAPTFICKEFGGKGLSMRLK